MRPRLHAELVALFGASVVRHAALLRLEGQVASQRAYVAGLSPDLRLLLCMWIMDTGLPQKIVRALAPRDEGEPHVHW